MNPAVNNYFPSIQNLQTLADSVTNGLKAYSSEIVTIGSSVSILDKLDENSANYLGVNNLPKAIYCYVDSDLAGKAVRYTITGETPDPSIGLGIAKSDGDEFIITDFSNILLFRLIEETAGATTVYVTYLK